MERGLYIAAAGMAAGMARQDLLANNLANATTPGYKSDFTAQREFGSMLLKNTVTGQEVGKLGLEPRIDVIKTDLTEGSLKTTGEPLDFAIVGKGFFAVDTPNGTKYTRNGQFMVGGDGKLADSFGNHVLGPDKQPIAVGKSGDQIDVNKLGVFSVDNPKKQGSNLFSGTATGKAKSEVISGTIETSNIDPAHAMVEMMESMRAYESGQKVINTIDESLGKATTQVGSLT